MPGVLRRMKRVILQEPGKLFVQDAEIPQPGPGDAVIRVRAALTCGTDLKAFRRGHPKMPTPTPFGHEYSGEIVALGSEVERFAVGDAILAANTGPCGTCFYCQRDQENLCETIMDEMVLGAYAEYLLVPARVLTRNAFVKPTGMPFPEGALLEPLASVCFGMSHVPARCIDESSVVLIIGAGPIAMLWLAVLRAHGSPHIIVAGRGQPRLQTALAAGADGVVGAGQDVAAAVRQASQGRGADLVVECTGLSEVWQQSLDYTRTGGTVILFGGCASGSRITVDPGRLHYDGVSIVSPFHFRPRDVAESFRLLSEPTANWSHLISGSVELEEVPQLFAELGSGQGMKYAVLPNPDSVS